MSTFKVGDRIRVVTLGNPDFIGLLATVLEDSRRGRHTRKGIPVETTCLRFDQEVVPDQGYLTRYVEMPSDQLELLKDPT